MIKKLFLWLMVLVSSTAHAEFSAGQILTASELNAAFASTLPIAGGTLTGPLTVPTLTVTGSTALSSFSSPNATITGGSISGLSSPISFASGGTNATTQAAALTSILGSSVVPIGNLPIGTSGNAVPLLNGINAWSSAQTFNAAISPYAGIIQTGGLTTMTDLTAVTGSGFYASGAGSIYSFYPTIGFNSGDHQRAQQYLNFNSVQNGSISETGIAINATMNTGYVPAWAQSTVYATGALIDTAGNVYKATTGGTSASSGAGPSGTGSSITDGSVTWAFQCVDQCNAKMPFFVSAVAGPNAGKVWAGDVALTLQSGWAGLFASAYEIDLTNNSGSDCTTCQNLLLTGNAGPNKIQAASSAYGPSATYFSWINGYQVTGAKAVTNASFYDAASGTYSYQDTGTHTYGVILNGNYSAGALWANQSATLQYDFARINLFPASNSNLNRWRIISNANGSSAGCLVLQTTTDGFGSSFINPLSVCNGSATITGATSVTGNLSATGTGAMPLYSTTGTGVSAPHMVQGTVALASGSATVTLSGSAAYTSSSSYTCTANDTTSAAAVKVGQTSGTSITLTGTGTDTVQFICAGN
ncbi:hypothetical protein [Burkholderia cenocepacia]|uniref:hypothetical protein n=1 Tax=Burkholderia cenocepacia TaxID=95486 RepID=UPI0020126019|nr:hypothetical protein [Burkholderia cenocepacia]